MNRYPIDLYVVSRRHPHLNENQIKEIEETSVQITQTDQPPPSITPQNVVRFISWMVGWDFIRNKDFPPISKQDVLNQIKDFVEKNTSKCIAGEDEEPSPTAFIRDILNTFTDTIDSLSSTLLKVEILPHVRPNFEFHIPPFTAFRIVQNAIEAKIIPTPELLLPHTSETILKEELEYYVNNGHFRRYKQLLTDSQLMMYRLFQQTPNMDPHLVFEQSMNVSYERTFQANTSLFGVALLKAEIADFINSLEIAVQTSSGDERDHHFEAIRIHIIRNMYDSDQLYLILKEFEEIKKITTVEVLHSAIEQLFTPIGTLLSTMLNDPTTFQSNYEEFIIKPTQILIQNLNHIHTQLCVYTTFRNNDFGLPHSMVDIISAHMFQILLLMMAGIDESTTTKICIHIFGTVLVDMFYQRLIKEIWTRIPTNDGSVQYKDRHIKYVMTRAAPISKKYNIVHLSQLSKMNPSPNAKPFQDAILALIKKEKWDNTFFDFLLTYNFSEEDRHTYNVQAFARKLATPTTDKKTNVETFGRDIVQNITRAIIQSQSIHQQNQHHQRYLYLYDRSIISAVLFSHGVEDLLKTFKGGTFYHTALSALLSTNSDGNK